MNIKDVVDAIKQTMQELGLKDHLPTVKQVEDTVNVSRNKITKVGGMKNVSLLLGIPMAPRGPQISTKKWTRHSDSSYICREDVIPSKAFDIQRESGRLWGDIQKEKTLKAAGSIDLSKYEGLKPYSERMKNGKKH